MQVEELLKMLQDKGMDDNAIRALLSEALSTIDNDDKEHDEKVGEKDAEAAERAEASKLLGVSL